MKFDRIIIVDDSDVDRYLLKRLLKKLKLSDEFQEAENGAKAFELLAVDAETDREAPLSLITLDINMPILSGFELLEKLENAKASGASLAGIKVVMVSSSDTREDMDKAKDFDFVNGFITKFPSDATELQDSLATMSLAA